MDRTQPASWALIRATESTDTSLTDKVATITKPVNDGVVAVGSDGRDTLELLPLATAGENDTFAIRVIGWRQVLGLWAPTPLCTANCIACAKVGVAGQAVVATQRFCDSITVTSGIGVTPSVAADTIAELFVTISGYDRVEVLFDTTAAGTTGMNALYVMY